MMSHPTDSSADITAAWNIGPETRLSRPTTMRARPPALARAQAPNPAANFATISGVSASPTRPRTPETLTINPSFAIATQVNLPAYLFESTHAGIRRSMTRIFDEDLNAAFG